jgi:hypothetical protein
MQPFWIEEEAKKLRDTNFIGLYRRGKRSPASLSSPGKASLFRFQHCNRLFDKARGRDVVVIRRIGPTDLYNHEVL